MDNKVQILIIDFCFGVAPLPPQCKVGGKAAFQVLFSPGRPEPLLPTLHCGGKGSANGESIIKIRTRLAKMKSVMQLCVLLSPSNLVGNLSNIMRRPALAMDIQREPCHQFVEFCLYHRPRWGHERRRQGALAP